MRNKTPLVSIGLATCNGAQNLRRALDSILSQTYRSIEVIVSDNASTDDTPDIVREYGKRDPRLRSVRQEENIGAANNYLFLLREARGKYFMWATDDDWYDQKFIEALVKELEAHPECGVGMSSFERRFPDGAVKDRVLLVGDLKLTNKSHAFLFQKIIHGSPVHVYFYGLFRKELLTSLVGRGFPKCIRPDRVFMAEVALATRFASVEPVLYYKTRSYELPEVRILSDSRYAKDAVQQAFRSPLAHTRYLSFLLLWPLTSRIVPLHRKMMASIYWPRIFWAKKGRVAREVLRFLRVI